MFIRCSELGKIWQVELLLINLPSDEEIKLLLKAKEENTIDELHVAWRYLYLGHKQGWWHLTTWWHWVWCLSCSEVGKLVCSYESWRVVSSWPCWRFLSPRTQRKRHAYTAWFFLLRFGTKQKTSYWPLLVSLCSSGIGSTWFIYVYLISQWFSLFCTDFQLVPTGQVLSGRCLNLSYDCVRGISKTPLKSAGRPSVSLCNSVILYQTFHVT